MRFFLLTSLVLLSSSLHAQFSESSVLSTGDWFKLRVEQSGVYEIKYEDLINNGIDPSLIRPDHISVWGNGGSVLPQNNSAPVPDDLKEVAITVTGSEDGEFNEGEKILFYAQGATYYDYSPENGGYKLNKNLYSRYSYYYLLLNKSSTGKRIESGNEVSATDLEVNSYNAKTGLLQEFNNFLKSGRKWHGRDLNMVSGYTFDLKDIIAETQIRIDLEVFNRSYAPSKLKVKANSTLIDDFEFSMHGTGYNFIHLGAVDHKSYVVPATNNLNLNFEYFSEDHPLQIDLNKNRYGGFLNYLVIQYDKELKFSGDQFSFSNNKLKDQRCQYKIHKESEQPFQIWKITDISSPVSMPYAETGDTVTFSDQSVRVEEYTIFSGGKSPLSIEPVVNQNLHAIGKAPTLLIVTHPDFEESAEKLANYHKNRNGYSVEVATTEEIYNEFSSGKKDVSAIRNYVKMVYHRSTGQDSLKYLLLFGDASYDYKSIKVEGDFVPTYQSIESVNPLKSYPSDDFYGFLEPDEGEWREEPASMDDLEIGIGRLPASTVEEAQNVVEKIINYGSSIRSDWNNTLTWIADDAEMQLFMIHLEDLIYHVDTMNTPYRLQKIFIDDFVQTQEGSMQSSPEARKAVLNSFKGSLIINYVGHGHEGWADERILDYKAIDSLQNKGKEPFVISAACSFNRYDNPSIKDCSERLVLKKEGGAIGTIAAARLVYANSNFLLNSNLVKQLFGEKNRTLGDVFKLTKNNSITNTYNRNYILIGDPSMRLAYPQDKVNGTYDQGQLAYGDTLIGNEEVAVAGKVEGNNSFEGYVKIQVFDKESTHTTLGGENEPFTYTVRENLIFEDSLSISGPEFSTDFTVPVSVGDSVGSAKVVFYAVDTVKNLTYHGVLPDVKAGSINDEILSYFNETFAGKLTAYPNPFSNYIKLDNITESNSNYDKVVLEIISETGRNIATYKISPKADTYTVNTGQIPAGFYILNLKCFQGGDVVQQKIMELIK